ncbi:epoxide hydrolase [Melanomma pulvis-pyrius CBS 109.77]|uniref:Epoxide hydrolase n=1 Tax=Melanomma pulvis-pyrius CBS 109.77 TaxID=1314802 RepID=A0A6A6XA94_9PLEO|nr:epoxide hydrolase [Melanomma pulvis-pyrius CBS 109.77]
MAAPYATVPKGALKQPTPFKIEVPQSQLEELKTLLKYSRIPTPTFESLQEDQKFGISHKWITEAKKIWLNSFDWREIEGKINSFPNFKATVHGKDDEAFDMHFIALFSEKEDAVPILLNHGWPGSFLEFLPMLQLMKDQYTPQTLPYHLIATSMPGYGFSTPPPQHRELGILEVPAMFNQLMLDLGFKDGYISHGGDIGSRFSRILAAKHEACKAIHVNYGLISQPESVPNSALNPIEQAGVLRGQIFTREGTAYSLEHKTKPSTIGIILSSTPLALLAWIGEKFLSWTDTDPPLDTILESVTLYWLTEGGARSLYPYRQTFASGMTVAEDPEFYVTKPLGHSYFAKEIVPAPRSWVENTGNLVFYRQHEHGGHFPAIEQPVLLKGDIEDFVAQVWKK